MPRNLRGPLVILATTTVLLIGGIATGRFAPNETKITEIAPGVFFRKCQTEPFLGCNQGWVLFKDFVLVIDANFPGQAAEVVQHIRATTDKPIRYVFDTHYHGDHADGNQQYTRIGATAVANENSKTLFETKGIAGFRQSQTTRRDEYGALDYEQPSLYFPGKLVLDDGTQRVELLHFGHAHTAGDAVAWLPEHGILFTGDACVNGAFNYTGDSKTESWVNVLARMQELPVKQLAPGHGELSDAKLLSTQKKYFTELREAVQGGIDAKKSLDEIKQSVDLPWYRDWAGVDVKTRTENIEHVYKELTAGK
jgi:glyoxylase-like metal-dependent hydrolase (beta-lactamase superfamily II)